MEAIKKYRAADGKEFNTKAECEAHEKRAIPASVSNLSTDEVEAAIAGRNPLVADSLEFVGNLIANERRKRGDLRRAPAKKTAA